MLQILTEGDKIFLEFTFYDFDHDELQFHYDGPITLADAPQEWKLASVSDTCVQISFYVKLFNVICHIFGRL